MARLSTASGGELTTERLAVYWDALCDLSIESVEQACNHAARYWRPSKEEGWKAFPLPSTLREYAAEYRLQQRDEQASARLAQREDDGEDIAVIHALVEDLMATIAQKEAAAKERQPAPPVNPPDPTRWLPLTENFARGPGRALWKTPAMEKLMDVPPEEDD
jgi:hypothetical protein